MKTSCHLRTAVAVAVAASAALFAAQGAAAATLYDASLNSLPSAQGWFSFGTPGYTQSAGGGAYTLDTTAAIRPTRMALRRRWDRC